MMSLSVLFFFLSFILLLQYWYRDIFGHEIFWYQFATFLLRPNFQIQFFWHQHRDPKKIGKSLETEMPHSVLIKPSELTAEQPSEDLVSVLEQRKEWEEKRKSKTKTSCPHNYLNLQQNSQVKPAASRRAGTEWQQQVEYSISGKWYYVCSVFCCYYWSCINLCCKWHFLTQNGLLVLQ